MEIKLKDNAIVSIHDAGEMVTGGFCETCYYEEWVDAVEIEFADGTHIEFNTVAIKPFLDYIFTGLENDTLKDMTEYEFIEEINEKLAD